MKNYFFLLWLLLFTPLFAQRSAFVLVDVSGNPLNDVDRITSAMRQDAVDLAKALITNTYNSSFDTKWEFDRKKTHVEILNIVDQKGSPLISIGGRLMIMPFGARDTYKNFQINPIKNPDDINRYWRFPFNYVEQQTFGVIARARAANVAVDDGIQEYYLVVIEGKGEDTNSWTYTPTEIEYMDDYRSASNINSLAVFRYRNKNLDYKVEVAKIDVTRLIASASGASQPIITPGNVSQKELRIVTPKGDRESPQQFSRDDKITISWRCLGCPDSTRYRINIRNMDNTGKRVAPITVFKQINHRLPPLEEGTYQIRVSGDTETSQSVYIAIGSSGGWGWLFFLLFIVGAILLGRFVWKNYMNQSDDGDENQHQSIFDQSKKQQTQQASQNIPPDLQSGSGSSSSSDYF